MPATAKACRAVSVIVTRARRCIPTVNSANGVAPIGMPSTTPAGISTAVNATGWLRRNNTSPRKDSAPAIASTRTEAPVPSEMDSRTKKTPSSMARAAREISSSHDLAVRRRITASTLPAKGRAGQSTLVYGKSPSVGIDRGLDRRRLDAVLQQTTTVPTPWWARTLVWLCLPAVGAALVLLLIGVLV